MWSKRLFVLRRGCERDLQAKRRIKRDKRVKKGEANTLFLSVRQPEKKKNIELSALPYTIHHD
jgi:hypothetical protein